MNTCKCGHGEREHTDRLGRCHGIEPWFGPVDADDTCDCLAFDPKAVA